jgi:hypothetical protein
LAFDPFVQQILQYPGMPSPDPRKEASVLRSSNFAINATSTDWLNAISAGIWSGAERFAQQPSCPSGNCTWGEYSSTGWCSKCQDATSYATITDCEFDVDRLDFDRLNHTGFCSVDYGHGEKFQVLTSYRKEVITESAQLSSVHYPTNISTLCKGVVWPLALLNYNLSMPLANETYAGVTNPVVALGNVNIQRCDETALEKGLCITFAEECVLSLCTRQFETSVVNGTTETTITNENFGCLSQVHVDDDHHGQVTPGIPTHCWGSGRACDDLHFTNLSSLLRDQDLSHPGLEFCSDGIIVQDSGWPEKNDILGIPNVQGKLLTRLTGNQTADLSTGKGFREDITTASSYTMEFINATGLGPVLAGVAASLTQQALLGNTSAKVTGPVLTIEAYVAVDWPWLIYPATLVLSSIVLLALTALHSHRCGLRIWKSSMLPLLYRTLDPDLLAQQPVLHDVSTMTGVAGKAKVTLVETSREDGGVLTQ